MKEMDLEKRKSPPPWLGRIRPKPPSPSLPRVRTSPPPEAQCGPSAARVALVPHSPLPRCQPGPTRQSRPSFLPRDRPLSGRYAPLVSSLPLSPVIGYRRDHRRPPLCHIPSPLLAHQPNWRLAPVSSHPVTTVCPEPSRRYHCVPSSPLRQASLVLATSPPPSPTAYKRTARAPAFFTPASATPLPPSPSSIEPAPPPSPSAPVSSPSLLWWPRVKLVWLMSFTTSPRTWCTLLPHLSHP
jgi:hypothetical protein